MRWFQLIAIIFTLSATGCASVFSDDEDNISFTSDPAEVKVYMNDRYLGRTPIEVTVKRIGLATGGKPPFRFEKEGYIGQEVSLTTQFNKTSLWNSTSVPSYITDAFTGTITEYSPTSYYLILEEDTGGDPNAFFRRSTVQKILLNNYYELGAEVVSGGGENVDSLFILLDIEENDRDEFLALLKSTMLAGNEPPDFVINLDQAMKDSETFRSNSYL